jgi:hypothetical protein
MSVLYLGWGTGAGRQQTTQTMPPTDSDQQTAGPSKKQQKHICENSSYEANVPSSVLSFNHSLLLNKLWLKESVKEVFYCNQDIV